MRLDLNVAVRPGNVWGEAGWTGTVTLAGREVFTMTRPGTNWMTQHPLTALTPTMVADAFAARLAELLKDGVVDYS